MNKGQTVLVTGGAGFIGSNLCERLLNMGNSVICLDNFFTGRKENIVHLMKNEQFKWIQQDVIEPIDLEVDQIYNLACPASPIHYQWDPIQTLKTSVWGAMNVLELAKKLQIPVFQSSTSEVYGDPLEHPQTERYWGHVNPIGIRSCYDEGKRCAETLFMDFYRRFSVHIKVVRIFNTYGPKMRADDGRVVSNFIVQALNGEDLTIYGEGTQTRSFCYVDDLIDGFIKMMNSSDSVTGPINLGNPGEFTMLELAEKVIKITNSNSKIVFKPLPQDDPVRRKPDISQAKQILDWEPKISLNEGLKKTILYFENEKKKNGNLRNS